MNKNLKAKIKAKFEAGVEWVVDHPVETLVVMTTATALVTKLLNAATEAKNAKTWEREVDRRVKKTTSRHSE